MITTKFYNYEVQKIPYIIAEIGLNHNGDENLAVHLLEAAARAGADAVKFQLYQTENFIEKSASFPSSIEGSLYEFFKKFELSYDTWIKLRELAERLKVDFICSVFDYESLIFYKTKLNDKIIKIASTDLNNYFLLDEIKKLNYQMIISTGASEEQEIEDVIRRYGKPYILMQCVSNYPANPKDYQLSLLPYWKSKYNCNVGISDHTIGNLIAIASFLLGSCAIEKHFTIDKKLPGPDQSLSITPEELRNLKQDLKTISQAIGEPNKIPLDTEENVRMFGRRSLYYKKDLEIGHKISKDDLIALRPGGGIPPNEYVSILDKELKQKVKKGDRVHYYEFL